MRTPQAISKSSRVARQSPAAQEHLRAKYDHLVAWDLIQAAEQFIDKAATGSSLSSQPYQVRCHGGPLMTSQPWRCDELARLRNLR
jgi:plasmid stabilization system protein ParE